MVDIAANLQTYIGARGDTSRYISFDYCFNHFQEHREADALDDLLDGEGLERSCLHLGLFLASWGMYRGKAPLLRRSVRTYAPVIEAALPRKLREFQIAEDPAVREARLRHRFRRRRMVTTVLGASAIRPDSASRA